MIIIRPYRELSNISQKRDETGDYALRDHSLKGFNRLFATQNAGSHQRTILGKNIRYFFSSSLGDSLPPLPPAEQGNAADVLNHCKNGRVNGQHMSIVQLTKSVKGPDFT